MNIIFNDEDKTLEIVDLNYLSFKKNKRLRMRLDQINYKEISYSKYENEVIIKLNKDSYQKDMLKFYEFLNELEFDYISNDGLLNLVESQKQKQKNHTKTYNELKNLNYDDEKSEKLSNFINKYLDVNLRKYQYESALRLIKGNGGFEFSVPGSGKTIITYTAYSFLNKVEKKINKLLIIGPKNAVYAWYDEYLVTFLNKPDFKDVSKLSSKVAKEYFMRSDKYLNEISFINFDKIKSALNHIKLFLEENKVMLVIDEGHKVKNPNAKVTQAAMDMAKFANIRVLLTGTPMPNGYEDLYPLTKVYSPAFDILPYNYGQLCFFTKNSIDEFQEKRIMESIQPYFSRVSKTQLIKEGELLDPIHEKINLKMDEEQISIDNFINQLYEDFKDSFEDRLNVMFLKALIIRKMQISANPGLLKTSILSYFKENKNEFLDDLNSYYNEEKYLEKNLEDYDNFINEKLKNTKIGQIINDYYKGDKISNKNRQAIEIAKSYYSKKQKLIIWDVFVENMELIYKRISTHITKDIELVNGSITGENRDEALYNFKHGSAQILVASPSTLAESISLHKACQNAVYINRNFNAAEFIQSKDRIHRIGMPKNSNAKYFYLINQSSIDETINDRLKTKENRMLNILDSKELTFGVLEDQPNTNMTNEDIKNVFKY